MATLRSISFRNLDPHVQYFFVYMFYSWLNIKILKCPTKKFPKDVDKADRGHIQIPEKKVRALHADS